MALEIAATEMSFVPAAKMRSSCADARPAVHGPDRCLQLVEATDALAHLAATGKPVGGRMACAHEWKPLLVEPRSLCPASRGVRAENALGTAIKAASVIDESEAGSRKSTKCLAWERAWAPLLRRKADCKGGDQ